MHLSQAFGGLSVILVGDIAHLSPAGDKPLFHSLQKSDKQIQGHLIQYCAKVMQTEFGEFRYLF